jgi:glycerophosphoryl diester phosphodiesterase
MATRTLRLAHRGDWRHAPENSLAAFAAALAIPACDGLEFDVRPSADGTLVTCHDDTLQRTHGRPDRVDALSADACEALGIPSLADVLRLVGRRPFLDIELKGDPGPTIVQVLAAGRGPELANAVVSSFEEAALLRVAHLAPSWPRWLNSHSLTDADIAIALGLGCRGIAAQWQALDARSVASAQEAGLEVASWTVRRRPTFDRLERLGVVAVCVEANALDG